jgi:DNA-directed RNA polymerase specialized sigma24 family protein
LHVARGIHRFEGDHNAFRSWVFMVAHHRIIDERRASAADPKSC